MINKLRELRKEKRLTQQEVADFIGISQNNYSYWENDKVKIDNVSLKKLADYFNVTTDYILGREENKTPLHIPEILNTVNVAFKGGMDDLTQEDINSVADYVEFIRARKKQQNKGE